MPKIITWLNNLNDADLIDILDFVKKSQGRHVRLVPNFSNTLVPSTALVIWEGDETVTDAELRTAYDN